MSTPTKPPAKPAKPQSAAIPSADALRAYRAIDPQLPAAIVAEATRRNERAFQYAMAGLIIGGLVALCLIGGFIYLVMKDHGYYAVSLLGGGVLSMVAGFLATRLDSGR